MDTLSLFISVAAIIIAALAAGFTLWQARSSAQQVVEARRANRLIEEDQCRALERMEQERLANRVQWVMERADAGVALRNVGSEAAENVEVWTESTALQSGPMVSDPDDPRGVWLAAERVAPNASIRFAVVAESQHVGVGNEVLVTWRGQSEPVAVALPSPRPSLQDDWTLRGR